MQWVHDGGTWLHPAYGVIERLPDGSWQVTNPGGEVLEPFTILDLAKRYQEVLWEGWERDGEHTWLHRRFGRLIRHDNGTWSGEALPGSSIESSFRGDFDRAGFAISELRRLALLTRTLRVLGVLDSLAYVVLVALTGILLSSVLSFALAALCISGLRVGLDARHGWEKIRFARSLAELGFFYFGWWLVGSFLIPETFAHARPLLVAPCVGAGVLATVVRVLSMLAFAVLSATCRRRGISRAAVPEWMKRRD